MRAPKPGDIGSAPKPRPNRWICGTYLIESPASRPAHTRALVRSPATEEASMPGLPKTAMSATGRGGAAARGLRAPGEERGQRGVGARDQDRDPICGGEVADDHGGDASPVRFEK